jgi:hypothetical protein
MALICTTIVSSKYWVILLVIYSIARVCGDMVIDSTPFKIGLVRDLALRYAPDDESIYEGVEWWVQWINDQGGLKYPLFSSSFFITALPTLLPVILMLMKKLNNILIPNYQKSL